MTPARRPSLPTADAGRLKYFLPPRILVAVLVVRPRVTDDGRAGGLPPRQARLDRDGGADAGLPGPAVDQPRRRGVLHRVPGGLVHGEFVLGATARPGAGEHLADLGDGVRIKALQLVRSGRWRIRDRATPLHEDAPGGDSGGVDLITESSADRADMGTGGEPGCGQDRLPGVGAAAHHVGAGNRRFEGVHRAGGRMRRREVRRVRGRARRDPDVPERAYPWERVEVGAT